jgi:mitosis inhibitor protein kinase SWE1
MKPANVFITFEGTLKIGDFGMAAKLPVPQSAEREGDREYIAPEILANSLYDKPADIFSTGLMMVEIAANIILPDNGLHWQKLRSGDLSDAGRLSSGNLCLGDDDGSLNGSQLNSSSSHRYNHNQKVPDWAPRFMVDNDGALDKIVTWMTSPEPAHRPTAEQILATPEAQWVDQHRKAGAVVFEGDFGPSPEDTTNASGEPDPMAVDEDVNWRREV